MIVETTLGAVNGLSIDGVERFVEIPYAASTAGKNRFRGPQPREAWKGVRECTAWTTRTPQYPDPGVLRTPQQWYAIQGSNYAHGMGEDCLTLNIWTPAADDARRPLVVWIHGGGYTVGHAASEMSDGANFAARQDSVFVSVTHRLNAFGFLHLEGLGGDDYAGSGNAGLLDIVAALEWVRDNIGAFGGDPGNVTIVGESGGGGKVSTLLVMPAAEGLIHRALCESGIALKASTPRESEDYARALIAELGGEDISVLRSATMQQVLDAQVRLEAANPDLARPRPVIDGTVIAAAPLDIWASGGGSAIPVLAGTIRDEVSVFGPDDLPLGQELPPWYAKPSGPASSDGPLFDRDSGLPAVERLAGRDVSAAADARRRLHPDESEELIAEHLTGDIVFRQPTRVFARLRARSGRATWVYQLDWASPLLAPRGAPHSSTVALFFANDERVAFTRGNAEGHGVATELSNALASLMRDGDPGWPQWDETSKPVMVFDTTTRVVNDPDAAIGAAFDAIDPESLL
ncbi:MAG: Carboxylesterase type [Microbacteriaceae bacterium]|nr:Carboxylesterase type [Microbacteriaceae bacterium]